VHSRGADRLGQEPVAVIAVAVLPAARHGNARDVVIAVVSVAGDAPVDVGNFRDIAVRVIFVFRLKRFLEHLCPCEICRVNIVSIYAVEIDRVVFLRGGDAAGDELPVLAVVIGINIFIELPYAVFLKRQSNAVSTRIRPVRIGLVAHRGACRLYPCTESKYITDLAAGVIYPIDIGFGGHAVAVDAERRYVVRGYYAGSRRNTIVTSGAMACPAAQSGTKVAIGN